MTRRYPSMVAPEGHRHASPAPSGQGVSGEVDYRLKLAMALFEARYGMRLMAWSDETRDYWLAQADATLAAPAPSCAPGEVERLAVATIVYRLAPDCNPRDRHRTIAFDYASESSRERALKAADEILAALSPQGLDAKEGGE